MWIQVDKEIKEWPDLFVGKMRLEGRILPVESEPFNPAQTQDRRWVLLIEVYPLLNSSNTFFVKIMKKG